MKLKIFIQPTCPACPPAKKLGKKLEKDIVVEYFDITQPHGLSEATYYDIMTTPTLILVEDSGKKIKTWTDVPDEDEVIKLLKSKTSNPKSVFRQRRVLRSRAEHDEGRVKS